MSNEQDVAIAQATKDDEQQQAVVVDDGSKETQEVTKEQEELTAEEKELQEHKDKVWNGRVDSEILKISKGEKSLDDLDAGMRKAVESKMTFKPEAQKLGESEEIANQVKEELILDSLLQGIEDDEQRAEAKADYKVFKSSGVSTEQAQAKVRKLYGLKTNDELSTFGQRAHSVGGGSAKPPKPEYTAAEQKYLKAMGVKL